MSSLNDLLIAIIKQYLIGTYCLTIFDETSIELATNVTQLRFRPENLSENILKSLDTGCSDYIIHLKDPNKFLTSFEESLYTSSQRKSNRRLIFAPIANDLENRKILIDLLKSDVLKFIPDVLLLLPNIVESKNNCITYEMGTNKYVGTDGHQNLIILDSWCSCGCNFKKNINLFANKLLNLQGKTITFATTYYKPYSVFTIDEKRHFTDLDGSDIRVAQEFCKRINCSIGLYADEYEWGQVFANGSGFGIFANVISDKADVGLGCLYMRFKEYPWFDMTFPLGRSAVTCIAPKPLPVPRWFLPFIPFNAMMWSSFFIFLLFGSLGLYLTAIRARKPLSVIESVMNTFGILILQVPHIKKPPNHLRQVMSWLLVLSLLFTSIYSSGLSSAITVPRYFDPVNSVEELIESGLEWGGPNSAWANSLHGSTFTTHKRLLNNFKVYSEEVLESKARSGDYAFCVERMVKGNLAIGEYITEETAPNLQLMERDIFWEMSVFIARKNSPLTSKLNELILQLKEGGLHYAIETQVVLQYSNFKVQFAIKNSMGRRGDDDGEPRALGALFLQGPFFMWGVGIFLALSVFIAELISAKMHLRRLRVKYCKNETLIEFTN